MRLRTFPLIGIAWFSLLHSVPTLADGAPPAKIDTGDTSWVLISAALVLLMTPGLAFFYGGMVRTKNVLSTLFQNYAAIGVVGLLWAVCGYSLVFSGNNTGIIGDFGYAMLKGVGSEPNAAFAATIPHSLFMLFQCMFAVITPALISGAVAERMRFKAWLLFMALWSLVIYVPAAHWVWGTDGWIRGLGGLDFAGGMVVHMTAGYSAIAAALVLGRRRDHGRAEARPYDAGMILLGAGLLWFGWFGFNAGSALGASGLAAQAFGTTFFASCAAFVAWTVMDIWTKGRPTVIGASCGAVAGLVTITPAAGFVTFGASIVMGLLAGVVCNIAVATVKKAFKTFDDSLDVFACHGVGGTLGTILTAFFATKAVNSAGSDGLLYGSAALLKAHLLGSLGIIAISMIGTAAILKIVDLITPIRATDLEETLGLDLALHGELINSNFSEEEAVAEEYSEVTVA